MLAYEMLIEKTKKRKDVKAVSNYGKQSEPSNVSFVLMCEFF